VCVGSLATLASFSSHSARDAIRWRREKWNITYVTQIIRSILCNTRVKIHGSTVNKDLMFVAILLILNIFATPLKAFSHVTIVLVAAVHTDK